MNEIISVETIHEAVQQLFPEPVYLVGGAVRDHLLGREAKDFDFCLGLGTEEIEACIRRAGKRAYLTGKRFGTIGAKVEGQMVEITTFRSEQYQTGSRKPSVTFVNDLVLDLSRRDFTVNAMARRVDDTYVDPFSGRIDLLQGVIKAVGKAKDRFREDPLRMLRAARFAAQLGFSVDPMTESYIRKMGPSILTVSKERWVGELDKLLLSAKPSLGLRVLATTRLLNFMLPELSLQVGYDQNSRYHALSLWEHTLAVVDGVDAVAELRWAALLHDLAKPFCRTDKPDRANYLDHEQLGGDLATRAGLHLKWSRARTEAVTALVRGHLEKDSPLKEADDRAKVTRDQE